MEVEAQQASVLLICGGKLRKLAGKRFTKSEIGQAFGKPRRFLRETAAPHIRQAGEVALRPRLFT